MISAMVAPGLEWRHVRRPPCARQSSEIVIRCSPIAAASRTAAPVPAGGVRVLKNIDPLLNADVLQALRAMGHGDRVVICDTNFPADSVARQTALGRLLRIDAVGAPRVARAILSVMPLDSFVDDAAARMEIVGR